MSEINYLWAPPAPISLPVRGTRARLPVNRLFFVGRNYQAHAREMGTSVDKASMRPVYFTKFSAMDQLVSGLNNTSSYLASQLSGLSSS